MNELVEDGKKLLNEMKANLENGKPLAIFCLTVNEKGTVSEDYCTDGIETALLLGHIEIWKKFIIDNNKEKDDIKYYEKDK